MTPQFHRFAVEELLDGVYFAPTYGNTLMGLATHKPPEPGDNYAIIYYPPAPRAMIEVVDPDQPDRLVEYGQTGRVRLTTLTREFFMPRFLERDEAEREPPCGRYPWDGVRNVRPFSVSARPSSKASTEPARLRCCICRSSVTVCHTGASTSSASRITGPASRSWKSARPTPA